MTLGNIITGAIGGAIIMHGYHLRQRAIKEDEDRAAEGYRSGQSTNLGEVIKRGDPCGAGAAEFAIGGLLLLVALAA